MTGWDTRAESGLRRPRAISTNINPTHGVAGHYGGSGPFKRSDHDACRAIWRAWQDFHMSPSNSNNYNDIAYNLGTCHHDIILEGRSTRSRPIVRGGANGNYTVNTNRYSVVVIWGANDGEWPDGLKRAWRTARDWLRNQDRRTGSGLTPHSAMSSTSCPGRFGRAFLAAGAPYPGSTPPPTGDDDMGYNDWSPADKRALLRDIANVPLQGSLSDDDTIDLGLGRIRRATGTDGQIQSTLARVLANQQAILQAQGIEVDETAIAVQVAAIVTPAVVAELGDETGATAEEVEVRAERAVRRVLGSVDDIETE